MKTAWPRNAASDPTDCRRRDSGHRAYRCAAWLLVAAALLPLAACRKSPAEEAAAWKSLQEGAGKLTDGLPDDEEAGKKLLGERLALQGKQFETFLADFPWSTNRWEARMALMQITNSVASMKDEEPDFSGMRAELQSIANDAKAPANIRADAELTLLQILATDFDKERTEGTARDLSTAINKFLQTHPDDSRAPVLRLTEAQALEAFDPQRARGLYEEAAKNKDPDISDAAKSGLELMAMREKPLELSFTGIDGRKVDMASLKGKVVLLDFWATWCPPCVEEVPRVVAAYEKFKGQGFEVVGISLDEDKGALEKFIAEHKMTWPQFFDGKGWENSLAGRFKIKAVPTMWLFGRDGKLVDPSPREHLEKAVADALAKAPSGQKDAAPAE